MPSNAHPICEPDQIPQNFARKLRAVQPSGRFQVTLGCLLGEEIDYDNFKSEVANHQGTAGAAYEHSLHDVWSVMKTLQK